MSTTELTRPKLLTVKEAALKLRCSPLTIRRRVWSGELPAVQLGGPGTALRIREDELERWLYGNPEAA
jgi:excisionase family DNA binding protein